MPMRPKTAVEGERTALALDAAVLSAAPKSGPSTHFSSSGGSTVLSFPPETKRSASSPFFSFQKKRVMRRKERPSSGINAPS